jgi:hypothetical protein
MREFLSGSVRWPNEAAFADYREQGVKNLRVLAWSPRLQA